MVRGGMLGGKCRRGFPQTTSTSTGIETSSAASAGKRSSLPLPISILNDEILAFDPAQRLQFLAKLLDRLQRQVGQQADPFRRLILLRERKTRPRQ